MDVPKWVEDHTHCRLKQVGLYYEGYVEDLDLVQQQHQAYTVSTYGTRRSRANVQNQTNNPTNQTQCETGKESKVHRNA